MTARELIDPDDVSWQPNGACADMNLDVFVPDEETPEGLALAKATCDTCPVRQPCLMWATLHGAEGYWGGTSTYQRAQLVRVRTRAKCPLCVSTSLSMVGTHELCIACGASWVRDVRLEPIAATPAPSDAA